MEVLVWLLCIKSVIIIRALECMTKVVLGRHLAGDRSGGVPEIPRKRLTKENQIRREKAIIGENKTISRMKSRL